MKRNSSKKKRRRILGGILGGLFALLFVAGIIAYSYLKPYIKEFAQYRENAHEIALSSKEEDFRTVETSLVYAADGSLISSLSGSKDVYYLEYSAIPKTAIDFVIVTEDRNFYKHKGFDVKAILVAAYSYIKNGDIYRGGSTITQQLARNIYLSMEVSVERKATEIFLATELEKLYSKEKILEFYMNNIYYANGYYGIQAAAVGYFGKSAAQLTVSELAYLSAIPNNPTKYDPLVHPENTLDRRDRVLEQLYEYGDLTYGAYKEALAEEIVLNRTEQPKQDYAETYSYNCAIRALMKRSGFVFREEFADDEDRELYEQQYAERYYSIQRSLYSGGYRIYTSIDPVLQTKLQASLDAELAGFTELQENGSFALQGSAVCIDNETGKVVAIIGGRSMDSVGYSLNRAYQSFRQAGSAIKPLIVYTPWFERGLSPSDRVIDEYFEGGPHNSGNYYYGDISIREAVAASANTVAWKYFTKLTPEVGLSYLLKMRFSKIVASDYVPAVALGGFTYGVSALEMASGYATLENDGVYRNPDCIVKIMDADGNILVSDVSESFRVYTENAARTMTSVLKDVMTSGTGYRVQLENAISAGKTGTATGQRDGWFAGYTKYYTTAVWVGYDYPRTMEDLTGSSYPGRIWHAFMEDIHEGLPKLDFEDYVDPAGLVEDEKNTGKKNPLYPEYNAFGDPIDPETGLPYPTPSPEPTEEPEFPEPTEDPDVTGTPAEPEPTKDPRDTGHAYY